MLYYQGWTSSIIIGWIEIILHGIICLIMALVLFIFLWVFVCHQNIPFFNESRNLSLSRTSSGNRSVTNSYSSRNIKQKTHEYYLKLILFCSIVFGILNVYTNLWFSNISILIFNIRPQNGCFYRLLCIIPLYLQRLTTYLFFLFRLKLAFNGSVYAISKLLWYSLLATLIGFILIAVPFTIISGYVSQTFLCTSRLVLLSFIIAGVTDVVYSILLCYIFVSKLKKLIKLVNNDNANARIKKLMKKLTILSMFLFLCF